MLVHTFATNVTLNRSGNLLLTSQASSYLRSDAKSKGRVARWGKKNFKNHTNSCNIVIAFYLVWNHWSLYILEEKKTIHFESILGHHDNPSALLFSMNVQRAWVISKGLKLGDGNFEDFMKVEFCVPKVHNQTNGWEWGHQVVENFATYVKSRDTIFFIRIVNELHMLMPLN
jgi:hypothetical protein